MRRRTVAIALALLPFVATGCIVFGVAGVVGATAKVGTWVIMIGFGASFSYILVSRIALLIGRLLFLLRDGLGVID